MRFRVKGLRVFVKETANLQREGTAMNRMEAIGWVFSVCTALRLSQAKTLADLVVAALEVGRVSIAELGRRLVSSTTAKHRIKRAWRFVANHRVQLSDAMQGVVQKLLKRPRFKRKALVFGLDWTQFRQFHTLAAVGVMKGRGVPLLWASYEEWELYKSQNQLEEGLLRLLRTMIPQHLRVILLADRGFGRTELARLCQELGFGYVIRISPDVWVEGREFRGKLLDYPVRKGICRLLRNVHYRKEDPVGQHVVVRWKRGLPKGRDECWFLMTDRDRPAVALSNLYARRMTIEQTFRDEKNRRNGFALRDIQVTRPSRVDRLLLILTLAYLLLVGIGLRAQQTYCPSTWCSNTRTDECSVFTIGRWMRDLMNLSPHNAFAAVAAAIAHAAPNWG
jgi:hypothetical protein